MTGGVPAVAVTSGTAALHVAYAAAGVGPGDEVVCAPMTFVATAATAAQLGRTVVFADVSPETGNLRPGPRRPRSRRGRRSSPPSTTPATRPTSTRWRTVAHDAGALLLEDAAHSIGGTWQGRPVGSLADLTTFSFFPTKNLTTAEGGAVACAVPGAAGRGRASSATTGWSATATGSGGRTRAAGTRRCTSSG